MKIWIAAVISILAFAGCGEGVREERAASRTYGRAADFELPDVEGQFVTLNDYLGDRPLVVVFWTAKCNLCPPMLKGLEELRESRRFSVLSVHAGNFSDLSRKIVENTGIEYPVLVDKDTRVSVAYGLPGFPTAFIIDGEGQIRYIAHSLYGVQSGLDRLTGEF